MSNSTLVASVSDAKRNQHTVSDEQLAVIWEIQCATHHKTDDAFGITPFLVNLFPDEIEWLDFACKIKPEFRSGQPIDWEVLRRISGRDSQDWMQTQRRLESKGIIGRTGDRCKLVWSVISGEWVHTAKRSEFKSHKKAVKRQAKGKTKAVFKSLRTLVAEAHPTCVYCGRNSGDLTMDHIIPRSQGGTNYFVNLASSCPQCNHAKADRTPEQWALDILQYRRRMKQKPIRLIDTVLHHRHTLGRLGHRIGYAITAAVTTVLAVLMLKGGHR